MKIKIIPMDEVSARQVLSWRYEWPYSFYNPNSTELEKDVKNLTDANNHYFAGSDEQGKLITYYCFGQEARVVGGVYSGEAIDMGVGIRPDLTGQGLGPEVIRVGIEFGVQRLGAERIRVTVAAFNERAIRACEKMGFIEVERFRRGSDGREFVILVQGAAV